MKRVMLLLCVLLCVGCNSNNDEGHADLIQRLETCQQRLASLEATLQAQESELKSLKQNLPNVVTNADGDRLHVDNLTAKRLLLLDDSGEVRIALTAGLPWRLKDSGVSIWCYDSVPGLTLSGQDGGAVVVNVSSLGGHCRMMSGGSKAGVYLGAGETGATLIEYDEAGKTWPLKVERDMSED